ncbi:procyclic acidic repetitive family protein [Blastopirellula sp. JC732]|uniref:Procyclic acidic repetitive family protein n=1 Tax=Blastopirellula sediminis TaxID=2894196 RepID=A0A9X1MKM0_9BACT|nr:procyclic acidic repetitive family protein [Blastopirellula sediminis]MCC9607978.1 procyclic acidic repetitive family protein [Blastopirellula sediminis]MCC9627229.1 procyclic acidic repetitive family protein [Blastopirellula sediminis]
MAILFVVTTLMTVMFLRPEAFGLGRADLPKAVATRNKSIDVSPVSKPSPEPQTNSPEPAPEPRTPAPAPQTNMTPPAQPMQTTTPTSPMPPAQANGASVAKLDTWKPIDTADFQPTNRQIDLVSYLMQFDEFRPYIQEAQKAAAGGRRPFPNNADLKRSQDSAKKIFEEYVEGPKAHDQHQYYFLESIKLALETKDSGADAAGILDVAENVSKYRRNVPDMLMATYVRICLYDVDSYDEEYQLLVKNISFTRVDSKSSLVDRLVWFEYCLSNARQRIPVAPEQALGYLEFILTYAKADRKLDQYHQEAAILVKQVDEVLSKRAQLAGVLKRFRRHPDSFRANLDLGFIYCFLHDDWATGLPYLAKSNYGGLSYGAQLELGPADTPEKQIAIGDEWWERRDKVREEYRGALLRHAAGWYQRALPNVTGANKVLLTQRIDAAAKAP